MALGNSTFADLGGAVSDLLGSQASARGLRTKAQGDFVEAGNYALGEKLAEENEAFTKESTAIKSMQAEREINKTLGGQASDIAGSGFAASGSALDIMRDSAAQGALSKNLLERQGLITADAYHEQAESLGAMSAYANWAGGEENKLASITNRNGMITGALKGAAALGTMFTGGGGGGANLFDLFTTDTHGGPTSSPF